MEKKNETQSVFSVLNAINCAEHVEKKNGLSYLSWAWAWTEVKKHFPDAFYTIYENANGLFYHTDGRTAWVKTGVTIEGIEHIEYLPVMDYRNQSITIDRITSFDVNKAVQRSLTKACARHGLGLYIYAGEDLPEEEKAKAAEEAKAKAEADAKAKAEAEAKRKTELEKLAKKATAEIKKCKTSADVLQVYNKYIECKDVIVEENTSFFQFVGKIGKALKENETTNAEAK